MEFPDSKIKKLIFSQKKVFIYILGKGIFYPQPWFSFFRRELSKLNKKTPSDKVSYISGNGPKLEKLLNFVQKIFFIYFRSKLTEPEKQKKIRFDEISHIFPKYVSYISGDNLQSLKNKHVLYFKKWNFLAPKLKRFLYFSKQLSIHNFLHQNFFITIFSIRIFRENIYIVSNILRHLFFFNNIFTFF